MKPKGKRTALGCLILTGFVGALTGISAQYLEDEQDNENATVQQTAWHGQRPFCRAATYQGFDDNGDGRIDRCKIKSDFVAFRTIAPYRVEFRDGDSGFEGCAKALYSKGPGCDPPALFESQAR